MIFGCAFASDVATACVGHQLERAIARASKTEIKMHGRMLTISGRLAARPAAAAFCNSAIR
jgi:hypothetical protein